MQQEEVSKQEVEELLRHKITDGQFRQAYEYARHKQHYQYQQEHRKELLHHQYLVTLTAEYVRNLAFSRYTAKWCRELCDMEKERLIKIKALNEVAIL